jgi:hypothetical protein
MMSTSHMPRLLCQAKRFRSSGVNDTVGLSVATKTSCL